MPTQKIVDLPRDYQSASCIDVDIHNLKVIATQIDIEIVLVIDAETRETVNEFLRRTSTGVPASHCRLSPAPVMRKAMTDKTVTVDGLENAAIEHVFQAERKAEKENMKKSDQFKAFQKWKKNSLKK
jgi:hypothetical protein